MNTSIRARSFAFLVACGALPLFAGCAADGTFDNGTDADKESNGASNESSSLTKGGGGTTPVDPVAPAPPVKTAPPVGDPDPILAPDPSIPAVTTLASGAGWKHVQVAGNALDFAGTPQSVNGDYYVFQGRGAIAGSGLPAKSQKVLSDSMATEAVVAGDDEIIIFPKSAVDTIELGQLSTAFSLCPDDSEQTFTKTYSVNKSYTYTKGSEAGGFTGTAKITANGSGSVTGTVKYKVKHHWYEACLAYPVIHNVSVSGAADVTATGVVDGSLLKAWSFSKTIANPTLGTITLPYVGIPVTFTLPVQVGLDTTAKADIHANATYTAHGQFNILCNSGGCDGSKSATHGFTPNGAPTGSATGRIDVTPWAQVSVHANVLSDDLAYAEVGVRAGLPTELWGYAGNTCGDADNNGVNEFVSGATIDMNVDISLQAKAGILGSDHGPWSWDIVRPHVGFWVLADGGLLDPILYSQSASGSVTATMRGRMRPCWPYPNSMSYQVAWGDGATTPLASAPANLFTTAHTYQPTGLVGKIPYGKKTITVQALSDDAGRSLNTSTTRVVDLEPVMHQ